MERNTTIILRHLSLNGKNLKSGSNQSDAIPTNLTDILRIRFVITIVTRVVSLLLIVNNMLTNYLPDITETQEISLVEVPVLAVIVVLDLIRDETTIRRPPPNGQTLT